MLQERQSSIEGSSARCLFRISSEGLPLILPHITKQILYASPTDFKHLLKYKCIKFPDFVDPSLREKAAELILGCCVVILRAGSYNLIFMKKDVQIRSFVLENIMIGLISLFYFLCRRLGLIRFRGRCYAYSDWMLERYN